jgi:cytochrome c oxidase subunit 1
MSKAQDSVNVFGTTVAQHIDLNILMSMGAWGLALFQMPFIINLFISWKLGKKAVGDNPWNATTLEWATPTPPGHGNFLTEPVVYRGPYEYSRPDSDDDFLPQWIEPKHIAPADQPAPQPVAKH